MTIRVSALYYYPVKSCRGVHAEQAHAGAAGFSNDRRWMVVDTKGRFLTQRRLPQMALIGCQQSADGNLRLSAPGREPLLVAPDSSTLRDARVWGFDGQADDCGDEAAAWISDYLGMDCRLVGAGDAWQRPVNPEHAPPGTPVLFADGYPYLLISQASLDHLNSRLSEPVSMQRFRPNIVVDGCGPHAEDDWKTIRIGALTLRVAEPCARCSLPEVDPETGVRGAVGEPTATLKQYRLAEDGDHYFGQNLILAGEGGNIAVGDEVQVSG